MIAILGGYGDVGSHVCRYLLNLDYDEIRIGGRNLNDSRCLRLQESVSHQTVAKIGFLEVDYQQPQSLDVFVNGCQVLVNCAGPSHTVGDKAAKAAARAKIGYVDAAGDDPLYTHLSHENYRQRGLVAVLSAGLQPGFSALLPRYLAEKSFTQINKLTSYFGVLDRFTSVAAEDYLKGANEENNLQLAAWRKGRKASGVLKRSSEVMLPFFSDTVTTLPYLSSECERLAKVLSLVEADWFNAIIGKHILSAFNTLHGMEKQEAISAICRASDLDMAGRRPYVQLLLELSGHYQGHPITRTLALRGLGNSQVTAGVVALTTHFVISNKIPLGHHYCAQVMPARDVIDGLRNLKVITLLTELDSSIVGLTELEEYVV